MIKDPFVTGNQFMQGICTGMEAAIQFINDGGDAKAIEPWYRRWRGQVGPELPAAPDTHLGTTLEST